MNKITDTSPPFSRRSFLVTGSQTLAGISVAGMILLNGCARSYRPIENEQRPLFTIGFIGKDSDFQFYAQAVRTIPSVFFDFIDNRAALQGQRDAVIVAAPLKERAELARQILNAGSHLLVETPMATSYQEFDAIIRQANQQNKRVAIASFHRFFNAAKAARVLIDEIGRINAVVMQVNNDTSDILLSRHQQGFLGKALPLFDLVRWLCAKSPLSLYAHKNIFARFHKPEKNLHLLVELGNIPLLYTTVPASLSDSWTITLYGQQGHLKLTADGQLQRADSGAAWETVITGEPSDSQTAVRDLLADFVESCRTGTEPKVNALDGMAGIALSLAALQSAQRGQTASMVELPIGVDEDRIWSRESRRLEKEKRKTDPDSTPDRLLHTRTCSSSQKPRYLSRRELVQPFLQNGPHPLDIADRIARRIMKRYQVYSSYTTDLGLEGLLYLFDATQQKDYLNQVLNVWQFREEKNAATLDWKILFVCLHFETFLRTGEVKYIKTFLEVAKDFRDRIPRDNEGAVAYSVRPDNRRRIFIDMLQGYAIFMARAGWLSGDESFFDECVHQYQLFRQTLRNPQTGLWHQGRGWFPDSDMISPGHWNRGQGWVLRGMVESLFYIPKSYSKHYLMLNMLREFADSLIKYQDARGLWHQVTDNPAAYQETSGSAMFVHYFYKAIHNGWLPETIYRPIVEKGLAALLGFVDQEGLVANTSLGSGPLMSVEGYLHRPSVPGDSHSVGTTLMACAAPYLSGIHQRIKVGPPNLCE